MLIVAPASTLLSSSTRNPFTQYFFFFSRHIYTPRSQLPLYHFTSTVAESITSHLQQDIATRSSSTHSLAVILFLKSIRGSKIKRHHSQIATLEPTQEKINIGPLARLLYEEATKDFLNIQLSNACRLLIIAHPSPFELQPQINPSRTKTRQSQCLPSTPAQQRT